MEFDRNYMPYGHMPMTMPNCTEMCPGQCFKWDNKGMDGKMPPYMYGKYMDKWEHKPDMCSKYLNPEYTMPGGCMMRGEMNQMYHMHQNMEPIETMCGKTYNMLIVHVHKTMHKMMMENMGIMPKAISKDKFNKELNEMICEVMKKEEDIKKIVVIDRVETEQGETENRAFCPFCNGLLKDTLSILFVTELLKGGCTFCY